MLDSVLNVYAIFVESKIKKAEFHKSLKYEIKKFKSH